MTDVPGHTCDECGRSGPLHRHHEHHGPDVVVLLCPSCHMTLHRIRGNPGEVGFDATVGLTNEEARAVRFMALVHGGDEKGIRRTRHLADVVAAYRKAAA